MNKYEIVISSTRGFIYAEDVNLAKFACLILGDDGYGLRDENGELVLVPFAQALKMTADEIETFFTVNKKAIADVLRTVKYVDDRTSLDDIEIRALLYAKVLEKMAEGSGDNAV